MYRSVGKEQSGSKGYEVTLAEQLRQVAAAFSGRDDPHQGTGTLFQASI